VKQNRKKNRKTKTKKKKQKNKSKETRQRFAPKCPLKQSARNEKHKKNSLLPISPSSNVYFVLLVQGAPVFINFMLNLQCSEELIMEHGASKTTSFVW